MLSKILDKCLDKGDWYDLVTTYLVNTDLDLWGNLCCVTIHAITPTVSTNCLYNYVNSIYSHFDCVSVTNWWG